MSRLSVAPKSFTGMLTIPKLIEPLQIALGMSSLRISVGQDTEQADAFPQSSGVIHRIVNISC
jgi:hypothetical protein